MKQMIVIALKTARPAHHIHAAILALFVTGLLRSGHRRMRKIETNISGDKQVETTVAVVIAERGPGMIAHYVGISAVQAHAGSRRDIGERAVVVVVVQPICAKIRHIQIRPAIVVVVSDSNPEPPAVIGDARFGRNVGKRPIVIVVEQRRMRWCGLAGLRVERGSVDKINVEPAIVVVVQQSDTGALRFDDDVFLRASRHVPPSRQPRLLGHVHEDDRTSLHRAARRDGSMAAVELRLLRTSRRHALLSGLR